MKTIRKNLLVIFSFTSFALIVLSSCSDKGTQPKNEVDSCGQSFTKTGAWIGPSFGGYVPDTYTLGNERYFNFYARVDSICTDNHISCGFRATANDVAGRPINFRAAVEWLIFFERSDTGSITLGQGQRNWICTIPNVGLKQANGESAGSVFVNIYVHFPTLGSQADDSTFLSQNLLNTLVSCEFKYHKP